jgi:hypothetical protein
MDERDMDKTSFICREGQFRFRTMPFGLCNAGATFQRLMDVIMSGLTFEVCLIYLDDVIVFSSTLEEHFVRLKLVLERLQQAGLKLKPSKCSLLQRSVEFLGHVVSEGNVGVNPAKIRDVEEWPTPVSLKEVRGFVGLCSYYRRFVKDFGKIAAPLTSLSEKGRKFVWTEECQQAFKTLKGLLTSAPLLAMPNDTDTFILDTDASQYAIGAVLSQIQSDGERPVAYASRKLSRAEVNYCVTRKELLAVVYFLKYFHHYLMGRRFRVRTDHAALQWLRRIPEPVGQQARWIGYMEEFDFEILHRAGSRHGNADSMSRRPCRKKECFCATNEGGEFCELCEGDGTVRVVRQSIGLEPLTFSVCQRANTDVSHLTRAVISAVPFVVAADDGQAVAKMSAPWPELLDRTEVKVGNGYVDETATTQQNDRVAAVSAAHDNNRDAPTGVGQRVTEVTRGPGYVDETAAIQRNDRVAAVSTAHDRSHDVHIDNETDGVSQTVEVSEGIVMSTYVDMSQIPSSTQRYGDHGNEKVLSKSDSEFWITEEETDGIERPFGEVRAVDVEAAGAVASEQQDRLSFEAVANKQRLDDDIRVVLQIIERKTDKPTWDEVSSESTVTKALWQQWERLAVRNGALYRRYETVPGRSVVWQLVIPFELRKDVFCLVHEGVTGGHMGRKRTEGQLQRRAYWPGWTADVRRFIRMCDTCAQYHRGGAPKISYLKPFLAGDVWEIVSIDVTGPHPRSRHGNVYMLTIMDHFSKWADAFPIPNHTAATVARILFNRVFVYLGAPLRILSDQGPEFESSLFQELCRWMGIEKIRTTPYRPSTNGMVERYHRTLNSIIAKLINAIQRDWCERAPVAAAAYRASVHDTTGFSPNYVVFGKENRMPADLVLGCPPNDENEYTSVDQYVEQQQEVMRSTYAIVRLHLGRAANTRKKLYDLKVRNTSFNAGVWVWYLYPRRRVGLSPKWQRYYVGPYLITRVIPPNNVVLQKSRRAKPFVVHKDKVKLFHGQPPTTWLRVKENTGGALDSTPLGTIDDVILDTGIDQPVVGVDIRTNDDSGAADLAIEIQGVTSDENIGGDVDNRDGQGDEQTDCNQLPGCSSSFSVSSVPDDLVNRKAVRPVRVKKKPGKFDNFICGIDVVAGKMSKEVPPLWNATQTCPTCGEQVSRRSALKRHMDRRHSGSQAASVSDDNRPARSPADRSEGPPVQVVTRAVFQRPEDPEGDTVSRSDLVAAAAVVMAAGPSAIVEDLIGVLKNPPHSLSGDVAAGVVIGARFAACNVATWGQELCDSTDYGRSGKISLMRSARETLKWWSREPDYGLAGRVRPPDTARGRGRRSPTNPSCAAATRARSPHEEIDLSSDTGTVSPASNSRAGSPHDTTEGQTTITARVAVPATTVMRPQEETWAIQGKNYDRDSDVTSNRSVHNRSSSRDDRNDQRTDGDVDEPESEDEARRNTKKRKRADKEEKNARERERERNRKGED